VLVIGTGAQVVCSSSCIRLDEPQTTDATSFMCPNTLPCVVFLQGSINDTALPHRIAVPGAAQVQGHEARIPTSLLVSLGMVPRRGRPRLTVHCMLALKLDGCLLPLQVRVQLLRNTSEPSYKICGWPGLTALLRGAHGVGCEHWLPAAAGSAPGVEQPSVNEPSTPADVAALSGARNSLPGVLVLCLATVHR
jgi:hypothetical protein